MKTSYGKLAALAFALLLGALLLLPMRAGQEDKLILSPATLKMSVGGSYRTSCALSSDAPDQTLRYIVQNPGVADIAADGTVTALSPGETIITARASGGAAAKMRVIVDGTPLTELRLNTDAVYLEKGQFSGLKVSYNLDASDARLQWVSENEQVATVDAAGRIEAVGGGETRVSVISAGGKSASARVYVNVDATAAHISPSELVLGVGARVPLRVSFLPEDATDRVLRWASSDPSVLSVDKNGVLEATGVGEAYVSALTDDGLTPGMEVTVEPAPDTLRLSAAAASLERGETLELKLEYLNEDGSVNESVKHLAIWRSDDESVATVDRNGCVTALKTGSCRIYAVSDGISVSCRLKVHTPVREISLDRSEVYLLREETGTPIQLGWTLTPADPDDPGVSFASDNTQVAQVSSEGLVTLTGGYGTATVTASCASGASASFTVHVVTRLPGDGLAAMNPEIIARSVEALPAETPALPQATAAPAPTAEPVRIEDAPVVSVQAASVG